MEFVVENVKATREDGRAEEHDGLASVLREASASSFHASTDDRLCRGLGDAGSDGVIACERLGVVHATTLVLIGNVFDGSIEILALRLGRRLCSTRAHRSKNARDTVAVLLDRLAPRRRED